MADAGPGAWEVATALMDNLREAQRRAAGDVLRFAVVGAVFAVVRGSAASSVTFAGFTIANPRIVEFAVVPYAAFLATRFMKAQLLTDSIEASLKRHLGHTGLGVPAEVLPMDWGLSRNRSAATGIGLELSRSVTPAVMLGAVAVGLAFSWYDTSDADSIWCALSTAATVVLLAATLIGRQEWKRSFFAVDAAAQE